jgi:two-component system, OmpR family, response regulator CpxR
MDMPVITIFSGSYCNAEEVAQGIAVDLGYKLIRDEAIVAEASKRFQLEEGKLARAIAGKVSVFNKFTREKERALASLKVVLADWLKQDDLLFLGFLGQLIPRDISHVLKVCIIAELKYRTRVAAGAEGLSEKDALKRLHKDDEARVLWAEQLFKKRDPWAPEFYDIVIPMDKNSVDAAAQVIRSNVEKDVVQVTEASRQALEDFVLAAQVDLKLAREGHDVSVSASDGDVLITINKHVLLLSSLEEELKKIAATVPGVRNVAAKVGAGYYQTDIYRKFDFDVPVPSKVLLVDDEREFVQTLSERLQMRAFGSAVAYGGEEALSLIDEDEPEVMVLDLKMPGIDGLEVLRRVKQDHPDVEVIVLTGHGSKDIEERCFEMGACAYLEKPVDLDTLTRTMQEAYRKVRQRKP